MKEEKLNSKNEFGDEDTTIIVSNFIRKGDGEWNIFPKIEKFSPQELYPKAYKPPEWD